MQRISTYSLHKINSPNDFGFSPGDYSRFKFGDEEVARLFGRSLAKGFIVDHLKKNPVQKQIVVIASPYSFIPTATFAMKNFFVFELNRWLAEQGFPVIQEAKVHRTVTYKEDYGELDAEQRISLISNDSFHIDKSFLKNKYLLFLDDIKITGSHERMILKMVNEYQLDNEVHMLYFAELINKNIHPNIENYLNYFHIKSIFDIEKIIKGGNFCINTRIVKYILNTESETFAIFLGNQTISFINQLYDMALGNGYHTIEAYSKNLKLIEKFLKVNKYNLA
ncbi:MAG TPA: phosphoribosyltransferase family protein [Emticicia sp.]